MKRKVHYQITKYDPITRQDCTRWAICGQYVMPRYKFANKVEDITCKNCLKKLADR